MRIAAVLLAAGRSTRFGDADKIAAPLNGSPLGQHVARTLATVSLAARYAVTGPNGGGWPGFVTVPNDRSEDGMARSIGLGVAAARQAGAEAVLIVLADMPFVPAAHFERLIALCRAPASLAASGDGRRRMPPAIFGSDWFDALESLDGDRGARHLLDRAMIVTADPEMLTDIDTPGQLAGAQRAPGA